MAMREAINEYRRECETVAPDALLKRTRREQLFKALAVFDERIKEIK